MSRTVHARFDGKVFQPEEPVDIAPNTRVEVTIHEAGAPDSGESKYKSPRKLADLHLDLAPDASERVHEVLYHIEGR